MIPYKGPSPPPGSKFHRYALLLFRQEDKKEIQGKLTNRPR